MTNSEPIKELTSSLRSTDFDPSKRRPSYKRHLDASTVPVERAALARASALDDIAANLDADVIIGIIARRMAAEYRDFAEELHYW